MHPSILLVSAVVTGLPHPAPAAQAAAEAHQAHMRSILVQKRELTYDILASHPYHFLPSSTNEMSAKRYLQRLATPASALAALTAGGTNVTGVESAAFGARSFAPET